MGASSFVEEQVGLSVEEAFREAVDQASWEHGHGGYTGTIAEKGSFMLIPRPPRISARKVVETIQWADPTGDSVFFRDENERKEYLRKSKKAYEQMVAWYGSKTNSILSAYHDKWGSALAIEADPALKKSLLGRYERSRSRSYTSVGGKYVETTPPTPRGLKAFIFFGFASC